MRKLIGIAVMVLAFTACGDDGPSPAPNGEACVENGDCESALCVDALAPEFPLPDGLCTNECNVTLQEGCSDEEVCLIYRPTGAEHCYQLCEVTVGDNVCRDGWECTFISPINGIWACVPEQ